MFLSQMGHLSSAARDAPSHHNIYYAAIKTHKVLGLIKSATLKKKIEHEIA